MWIDLNAVPGGGVRRGRRVRRRLAGNLGVPVPRPRRVPCADCVWYGLHTEGGCVAWGSRALVQITLVLESMIEVLVALVVIVLWLVWVPRIFAACGIHTDFRDHGVFAVLAGLCVWEWQHYTMVWWRAVVHVLHAGTKAFGGAATT